MNEVGDHNVLGIIDRFAKTIKEKIYKHFSNNDNTKWVDKLNNIVENYNNTPHATLNNMTPNEAAKYASDTLKIHEKRVNEVNRPEPLKVGDIVRTLNKRKTFHEDLKGNTV